MQRQRSPRRQHGLASLGPCQQSPQRPAAAAVDAPSVAGRPCGSLRLPLPGLPLESAPVLHLGWSRSLVLGGRPQQAPRGGGRLGGPAHTGCPRPAAVVAPPRLVAWPAAGGRAAEWGGGAAAAGRRRRVGVGGGSRGGLPLQWHWPRLPAAGGEREKGNAHFEHCRCSWPRWETTRHSHSGYSWPAGTFTGRVEQLAVGINATPRPHAQASP